MLMTEFAAGRLVGGDFTIFVANHKTWKDGVASVTLPQWLYNLYVQYYDLRKSMLFKKESNLFFVTSTGGPVRSDFYQDINEWMLKFGYPKLTSNGLRKATQTGAAEQSLEIQDLVCANLGHSKDTVIKNYRHKTAKQANHNYRAVQSVHKNIMALDHFRRSGDALFPDKIIPSRKEVETALVPLIGKDFSLSEQTYAAMRALRDQ